MRRIDDECGSIYDKKFGPRWRKVDAEFWEKFEYWR
jgi:hypothetical protein